MSNKLEEEMAKAAGQIVVDTSKDIRGALGKIFGESVAELGKAFGDKVRHWRLKNMMKMAAEIESLRVAQGMPVETLNELPMGDAVRVIEAISSEDDEDVQKLWAQLIVNSANPNSDVVIKKFYLDLLKSLAGPEVVLLQLLWECQRRGTFRTPQEVKAFNDEMNAFAERRWRKFPLEVRGAAVQNLMRLRCLTFRPQPLDASNLLAALPIEMQRSAGFSKWAAIDPERFMKVLQQMLDLVIAGTGATEYKKAERIPLFSGFGHYGASINVVEMNHVLTALGQELVRACTIQTIESTDSHLPP